VRRAVRGPSRAGWGVEASTCLQIPNGRTPRPTESRMDGNTLDAASTREGKCDPSAFSNFDVEPVDAASTDRAHLVAPAALLVAEARHRERDNALRLGAQHRRDRLLADASA